MRFAMTNKRVARELLRVALFLNDSNFQSLSGVNLGQGVEAEWVFDLTDEEKLFILSDDDVNLVMEEGQAKKLKRFI